MQVAVRGRQIRPGGTGLAGILFVAVVIAVVIGVLVFNAISHETTGAIQSNVVAAPNISSAAGQRDVPVAGPQLKAYDNPGMGEGLVGGLTSRDELRQMDMVEQQTRDAQNRSLIRQRFQEANTVLPSVSTTIPAERPGHPK
jgi:hypothetical protein